MEILLRYSELGLFEEALYCARVFQMDMSVIFASFTEHCLDLTLRGDNVM